MTVAERLIEFKPTYKQVKKSLRKTKTALKAYVDRSSEHRRIIASERAIRELERQKDRALVAANRAGFIR
mgnify:CR=1 FL=1|jgi:predicted patatin/cPLA2 family phospholipase